MKRKIDFENDDFLKSSWYYKLFSFFLYWFFAAPVLLVIKNIFLRVKIKGKANYKKIKKHGGIIVCNHIHPFDAPMIAVSIIPTRMKIASLEQNFYTPIVGTLIKGLGALPVPKDLKYMKSSLNTFADLAKNGKKVLIFPEGHLIKYCPNMRVFKTGAFRAALLAGVPIIPMCYTYPEGKRLTLNILPAVYPKLGEDHKELTARVYNIMNAFFTQEMSQKSIKQLYEQEDEIRVGQIEDEFYTQRHA